MIRKMCNGYWRLWIPEHPYGTFWNGSKKGWVYEHRYVMEQHIGRYLLETEVVHHINLNRSDNSIENLGLLTVEEHARLHALLEGKGSVKCTCDYCGSSFERFSSEIKKHTSHYCSSECSTLGSRKAFRPSKEQLFKEVWETPSVRLSVKYGVSDRTIGKWCSYYSIEKPPRGYWSKSPEEKELIKLRLGVVY